MDSPAPSPTIAIDNALIVINTAIDTAVNTAIDSAPSAIDSMPSAIDNASSIVDTIIDGASPIVNIDGIKPMIASGLGIDLTAAAIIGPVPGSTRPALAKTGGFDMAFGLFNFRMDNDGAMELISISDSASPAAKTSTPPAVEGNPLTTVLLAPSEKEPRLKTSTLSVGSNDFEDPPPSPTTAYCVDCDAYHYVGAGDFSSHEIAGCEDPRGGTVAVYPTISECERALNALTLRTMPYDPDYVEGLYSDYTCSDDNDIYPEAKGKIGNSASSYSSKYATSSN
jgi:hypothetical protein